MELYSAGDSVWFGLTYPLLAAPDFQGVQEAWGFHGSLRGRACDALCSPLSCRDATYGNSPQRHCYFMRLGNLPLHTPSTIRYPLLDPWPFVRSPFPPPAIGLDHRQHQPQLPFTRPFIEPAPRPSLLQESSPSQSKRIDITAALSNH